MKQLTFIYVLKTQNLQLLRLFWCAVNSPFFFLNIYWSFPYAYWNFS
jgi:hypothetical protein